MTTILRLLVLALLAIFSVASWAESEKGPNTIPLGIWIANVDWTSTTVLDGGDGKKTGIYRLAFVNCPGQVLFELQDMQNAAGLAATHRELQHQQVIDTHLFFHTLQGNGESSWVELTSFSLVAGEGRDMLVQWSRVVSNPAAEAASPFRAFGQYGHGVLKKTGKKC
jgi:hypothetical protein